MLNSADREAIAIQPLRKQPETYFIARLRYYFAKETRDWLLHLHPVVAKPNL